MINHYTNRNDPMDARCPVCDASLDEESFAQLLMDPFNGYVYDCACGAEIDLSLEIIAQATREECDECEGSGELEEFKGKKVCSICKEEILEESNY